MPGTQSDIEDIIHIMYQGATRAQVEGKLEPGDYGVNSGVENELIFRLLDASGFIHFLSKEGPIKGDLGFAVHGHAVLPQPVKIVDPVDLPTALTAIALLIDALEGTGITAEV